jgi:Gas vesicle protein G
MSKREGLEGLELLGPLNLFLGPILFVAEQIADQAEEAMLDDKAIVSQLTRLGADLDAGRIDEASFEEQEAVLLERLEEIQVLKAEMKKGS